MDPPPIVATMARHQRTRAVLERPSDVANALRDICGTLALTAARQRQDEAPAHLQHFWSDVVGYLTPPSAPDPLTVYLTDNGAALCGAHLGSTAKHTGRDLSGQPIEPVTPTMAAIAVSTGYVIACETCGRQPSNRDDTAHP